jgi:serine/threonine protein kinase
MEVRPFDILPPKALLQERYRIVRLIGRGGMGAVYEATDTRLRISVALKQTMVGGAQFRKAFQREALLLARLRHAALPVVTDYFIEGDAQFLVMQFIPGPDLASQLARRDGPFPVGDVLAWADQLLRALEYLHSQDPPVIHRDIKPQNLKLAIGGEIVLLDFGLAKGAAAQSQVASSVVGFTPLYAPLEQIRGSGTGPRSDLYALAATLYHLLVGAAPADALERVEASVNGLPDPLIPPHKANPLIHPAIGEVLARALNLRADSRPADATEMRAALQQAARVPWEWDQDTLLVATSRASEYYDSPPADGELGPSGPNTTERSALAPEPAIGRARTRRRWALGGIALAGVSLLTILGLRGISIAGGSDQLTATSAPGRAELISTITATPAASPTTTNTPTVTPPPTPSPTLSASPTFTPTLTATVRPTTRPRPKLTSTPLLATATLVPPTELPTASPTELPTASPEPTRRSRPKPSAPPTAAATASPAENPTSDAYPSP